jgi:hypothetical protein
MALPEKPNPSRITRMPNGLRGCRVARGSAVSVGGQRRMSCRPRDRQLDAKCRSPRSAGKCSITPHAPRRSGWPPPGRCRCRRPWSSRTA